ncbi:MAG: hypothetical protein Q9167_004980, partial [Letrouitia subvulpina]
NGHNTHFPCPLGLVASHSANQTAKVGEAVGGEFASVGINWLFGSTLDLLTDQTEPLAASQTCGDDADIVAEHTLAFTQGLARAGVIACPNSRLAAPVVEIYRSQNYEKLDDDTVRAAEKKELIPLNKVVTQYPHSTLQLSASCHEYPDSQRASLAIRAAVDLLLRKKAGFQGPTVSGFADSSLESNICATHEPLRSFLSGADLVCLPNDSMDQQASISVLLSAINSSRLSASSIATSAARITRLKAATLNWDAALADPDPPPSFLLAHTALANAAYRASITALSSAPSDLIDLPPSSMLVLLTPTVPRVDANSPSDPFEPLGRAIARSHPRTRHVPYTLSAGLTSTHFAFLQRAAAIILVLCNTSSALVDSQDEVIRTIQNWQRIQDAQPGRERTRKVVIGAGDPRDLRGVWTGWWPVCCYEYAKGALEAVAEVVLGQREAVGVLPVTR